MSPHEIEVPACDAAYKQEILIACCKALETFGFTRYRKSNVDWPFRDSGFHGWVGLNTGLYSDRLEVHPFVGVHSVAIERLTTSLRRPEGRKYNRSIATYAIPFGILTPSEKAFVFHPASDPHQEIDRLARLYKNFGLKYSEGISSFQALLPLFEGRVSMLGGYPERIAVCLFLMGRQKEAKAFTESFESQHPSYFKTFADAFVKHMGT